MYNTCPIAVTIESQLAVNKGQSVVRNANVNDTAFNLIEAVCREMNVPYKSHLFLRLENGDIIHGRHNLGQAFG